jgi:hypothetical protein
MRATAVRAQRRLPSLIPPVSADAVTAWMRRLIHSALRSLLNERMFKRVSMFFWQMTSTAS